MNQNALVNSKEFSYLEASRPEYLKLSALSKLLPGRPSTMCLWRWCRHGLTTRSGVKVRLPHIRCGRNIMATREDCEAFFRAVAEGDCEYFDTTPPRALKVPTPSAEAQAAHARLAAEGM